METYLLKNQSELSEIAMLINEICDKMNIQFSYHQDISPANDNYFEYMNEIPETKGISVTFINAGTKHFALATEIDK